MMTHIAISAANGQNSNKTTSPTGNTIINNIILMVFALKLMGKLSFTRDKFCWMYCDGIYSF